MRGWRQRYNYFAGQRYPRLIAYAQLLTGAQDRADALVNHALRRTFGRWRRLGTNAQLETEIRRLIVARFLATTDPDDVAELPIVAPEPAKQPEVDPALYAPPGEIPEDSPEPHAPHQSHLRAEVEKPHAGTSESDHTHAALATLTPQARAITVLRHFDGLTAGAIATQLGLTPAAVIDQLHASHDSLRTQLNITIADEPDLTTATPADAGHHVLVMPHSRGRRHE